MKDFQHEQLLCELTPTEAAVVEGGKGFTESVFFDSYLLSRPFNVPNGQDVYLGANVSGGDDGRYSAQLLRVDTQPDQNRQPITLTVGSDRAIWRNQPGGQYRIAFRDRADGLFIRGSVRVDTGNFA
jgi:hypothetical protein